MPDAYLLRCFIGQGWGTGNFRLGGLSLASCAFELVRSIALPLFALGAMTALVVGCEGEEPHEPTLRRNSVQRVDDATEAADASAASPPEARGGADDPAAETGAESDSTETAEVQLTDLPYQIVANGHGPAERNMSNGNLGAGDGKPLSLDGVIYAKGLGVHANSEVRVTLGGQYKSFFADIGIDDEVGDNGSVVFQVLVDDQLVFDSGVMTGASDTKKVAVSVLSKQKLKLIVTDNVNGGAYDHADWASPRLVR
jgi:hypothetical protein